MDNNLPEKAFYEVETDSIVIINANGSQNRIAPEDAVNKYGNNFF